MPISNPGSGHSNPGSISVENAHYISQQILDCEVTEFPIILVEGTEEKFAREYLIWNDSDFPAYIKIGLEPGLTIPLEPGIIYENKDSGGVVNQITLLSGKIKGILKTGSTLPEQPEEPEPTELIFAPMSNENIQDCAGGSSVFAVPSTAMTIPIFVDFHTHVDDWFIYDSVKVIGYNIPDFGLETEPIFESNYYTPIYDDNFEILPIIGQSGWQISSEVNFEFIALRVDNPYGGSFSFGCAIWNSATNTFEMKGTTNWAN